MAAVVTVQNRSEMHGVMNLVAVANLSCGYRWLVCILLRVSPPSEQRSFLLIVIQVGQQAA